MYETDRVALVILIVIPCMLLLWWYMCHIVYLQYPLALLYAAIASLCCVEFARSGRWFVLLPTAVLLLGLAARYLNMWEHFRYDLRVKHDWSFDALYSLFAVSWPLYCLYNLVAYGVVRHDRIGLMECIKELFTRNQRKINHPLETGRQEDVVDWGIQMLSELISSSIAGKEKGSAADKNQA